MDRHTPIISPEHIQASLRYLLHKGITLDEIQQSSGVDLTELSNPRRLFSLQEVIHLIQSNQAQTRMPHYGLANGHYSSLSCHGLAGMTAMHQSTYSECLETGGRLCNLLFPPITMNYFETDKQVGLRLYECLSLAPCTQFFMEWIMTNFRNIFQFLLGSEHRPDYIAFPYKAPGHLELYQEFLDCPLRFETEHAEFVVNKELAQSPLPLADKRIAKNAEQHFIEELPYNDQEVDRQVRSLLAQHMDAGLSLQDVASALHMSSRTLRRHLQKQGTTFADIVDELRRESAISQLVNSDRSITEIASSLHFCDSSAFSKAFKRWTGKSPREFRGSEPSLVDLF
ncbi:MAG: hypothetical protein CMK89_11695 [Pseudomonadales bacterium]|nr:hypothetical protein [Pseudomonadales bacterium]RLU02862.1 MAG: AraC family transcriptional regulator [Ketobacter sp.]